MSASLPVQRRSQLVAQIVARHRPDGGLGIQRVAECVAVHDLDAAGEEIVKDAAVHIDPLDATAGLASVEEGAVVEESLIFENVVVEPNARLNRCIVAKNVRIPAGETINLDRESDTKRIADARLCKLLSCAN